MKPLSRDLVEGLGIMLSISFPSAICVASMAAMHTSVGCFAHHHSPLSSIELFCFIGSYVSFLGNTQCRPAHTHIRTPETDGVTGHFFLVVLPNPTNHESAILHMFDSASSVCTAYHKETRDEILRYNARFCSDTSELSIDFFPLCKNLRSLWTSHMSISSLRILLPLACHADFTPFIHWLHCVCIQSLAFPMDLA